VRHAVTLLLATTLYCVVPNGQQSVQTQNVISDRANCRKSFINFNTSDMLPIILYTVKIIYIVSKIRLFVHFNSPVPHDDLFVL